MSLTYIFYYIPEDNEDFNQLNYFPIQKAIQEINLTDIRSNFPIPGEYHFRFQYKYQGQTVWLDLSNENGKLPISDGMIVIKVLRTKWTNNPTYEKKVKKQVQPQTQQQQQYQASHSHSMNPVVDKSAANLFGDKLNQQKKDFSNSNRGSKIQQTSSDLGFGGLNWASDNQQQNKSTAKDFDLLFS